MITYPTERLALFIDAPNLHRAVRSLGWDIDYTRLQAYFAKMGHLVRSYFYTALSDSNESEYSSIRPLIDYLTYNGWKVVTKPIKEITDHSTGRVIRKGNMDVEIVIDMMRHAAHLDHLVLFSGDGDFRGLFECLQDMGKRVSLCSTLKSEQRSVADELRRQADNFIELEDIKLHVARDANTRVKAALVERKPSITSVKAAG